jgi:hypothetical protein
VLVVDVVVGGVVFVVAGVVVDEVVETVVGVVEVVVVVGSGTEISMWISSQDMEVARASPVASRRTRSIPPTGRPTVYVPSAPGLWVFSVAQPPPSTDTATLACPDTRRPPGKSSP